MAKRRSKKREHLMKQFFIWFTLILFTGGTFGYVSYYTFGGNAGTGQQNDTEFLTQNIFNQSVPDKTILSAVTLRNPGDYPNLDANRVMGGVWIEYSCLSNCSSLHSKLTSLVNNFLPRIYISPANLSQTLYLQSSQNNLYLDSFNQTLIEDFVCTNLYRPPDICALRTF